MRRPRGVKPRRALLGRLLPAGAFLALIAGAATFPIAILEPGSSRSSTPLSLAAIALLAGAIALAAGWLEEDQWRMQAAIDRFFHTDELLDPGSTWERWPRPPRRPRPKLLDQPTGKEFWMKKLAERYARLARLEEVRAPRTILEAEQQLIQKAIAELSPADALAVMRVWPELASTRHSKRRPSSPPGESN